MSFRIDPNARFRFDPIRNVSFALPPQQQKFFESQVDKAVRERADAGGPKQLDPKTEKTVVVEQGDSLWKIAAESNVKFADLIAANKGHLDANGEALHPNDVVIIPESAPELVAKSPTGADGVPSGEKAFLDDLYGQGNKLGYQDGISLEELNAGGAAIKADIGAYLDALPPSQRQAAALRIAAYDWSDGGPAKASAEAAIKERGLETDPEEAFAKGLYEHGNKGADSDDPNYDFAAEQKQLTADTKVYLAGLPKAERPAALQRLFDRDWTDGGPVLGAIETAGKELGITLRPSGHAGPQVEGAARKIIDDANAAGSPGEAFKKLADGYAKATPEVKQAIANSQDARILIQAAADEATQKLKGYDPKKASSDQGDAATVMYNLCCLVDKADPALAVKLMQAALPTIEAANATRQREIGTNLVGMEGLSNLMKIIDKMGDAPGASAIVERFADIGSYNINSIPQAIASGSRLDYPLALGYPVDETITPNVQQFAAGTVNKDVDAYLEHTKELQYLIASKGPLMTPEQLTQAIADYKTGKGPQWQQKEQDLAAKIREDGKKLLVQIDQLGHLPPELAQYQKHANDTLAKLLGDDKTAMALNMTLTQEPTLLGLPRFDKLAGTLRLTDRGRKIVEEAATQLIRRTVIPGFADFDPGNPATFKKVDEALVSFKDGSMAKMLGVKQGELDKAIKLVEDSLPKAGDAPAEVERKMRQLNAGLDDITDANGIKAFKNDTTPGKILRIIGTAATLAGLANSGVNFANNPTWKGGLKMVIDAAGVSQRVIELSHGFGLLSGGNKSVEVFGSSSKPAVKVLGAVGAVFDVWNAVDYFKAGDPTMGSLSLAAGGGTVMAALGTGTAFGPIGLAVVIGAVIAQFVVAGNRDNHEFETGDATAFLKRAGLSEEAATALRNQSREGYSPVPLLIKYGEAKGFKMNDPASRQAFIDWIDAMPKAARDTLISNLHHTLAGLKGDASKLTATASSDSTYTDPSRFNAKEDFTAPDDYGSGEVTVHIDNTASKVRKGEAGPASVAQIDVALTALGIAVPVA